MLQRVMSFLLLLTSVAASQVNVEQRMAASDTRRALFAPVARLVLPSVVEMVDANDDILALGLVVAPDLVLTKASELQGNPLVAPRGKSPIPANVLVVDEDLDVALLEVEAVGLVPASLSKEELAPGRIIISPGAGGQLEVGIVSVKALSIHRSSGFLGVMLETATSGGALVTQVVADSAAEESGLRAGDIILTFEGEEVTDRGQLITKLRERSPGDKVTLGVRRLERRESFTIELGRRRGGARTSDAFRRRRWRPRGTRYSTRGSGFKRAFQHDTLLDAEDCGGPVVDLQGRVVGLNIARSSRTESLAVPAADLIEMVEGMRARRAKAASASPDEAPRGSRRYERL